VTSARLAPLVLLVSLALLPAPSGRGQGAEGGSDVTRTRAAIAVPEAPARVRVSRVGVGEMTLRWRDRSSGESRYEVGLQAPGRPESIVRRPPNSTALESRGLRPGTRYRLRVRACGPAGCSRWSKARRQATLLAPLGAPYPALGRCPVFPDPPPTLSPSSPGLGSQAAWHQDISLAPLDPRSARIIAEINLNGDELRPAFGSGPEHGFPYVVVPGRQPKVPVRIAADGYPQESDFGRAPVPPHSPIEPGRDQHVLVVDRRHCELYELYGARYVGHVRNAWRARSTARFDLRSKRRRPHGWTSADAAGLPIFAGLVRYEEVAAGEIDHALRVNVARTRRAYVHPATHFASRHCGQNLPPLGMRLRLRAGYPTIGLGPQARVIAEALKRYGLIVTDNGGNWFFTGTTDHRWDDIDLSGLRQISGSDFEVVQSAHPPVTPC
jgi:hypothetical protein